MDCTFCKSEIPTGFHICTTCGHPFSIYSARENLIFSRLATYAPPALVQKVRSAPLLAKERRNVTAMMITVANINSFNKKFSKSNRAKVLNELLDIIAEQIYQYEGSIAKLWDHALLAFFGAPVSHEDDPFRAVYTASVILEKIHAFNMHLIQKNNIQLKVNIVLNTGQILIGNIKPNLKFYFKSLNNTLECIDRAINTVLPESEVILFEDTYGFVRSAVEGTKLEDIFCEKNKENLSLWRVDQINERRDPSYRLPISQNSALIGRKKELELLLELSETVLAGLGRVGLVLGEPGIGKSRLILEWKRQLKSNYQSIPIRWIEARGVSFGQELAYHLIKDLFRSVIEVSASTPESSTKKILSNTISEEVCPDEENLELYLAHLLDLELSAEEESQIHTLKAQELRIKYIQAIQTFFRCLSKKQPIIIILEDLHWADASSIDLLIELISLTASSPILFCLVARQDHDSVGWHLIQAARERIGPRLTEIKLDNLSENESQKLVSQLISTEQIPSNIKNTVLDKSEGNPYFIEELVRMLINEGMLKKNGDTIQDAPIVDTDRIPDSLQGLITARIDRLPEDARLTLRIASILGRSFPEEVIEAVMNEHAPDVELFTQLNTLEAIRMIKVAEVKPTLIYKFNHILLHEAAYHSIIQADRVALHRTVGNALERLYPDQEERLASQLAHHFSQSNDAEKAYHYLDIAGHISLDAYASAEAETYFAKAVKLTTDPKRLAHLYADLGEALAQQSKHREAITTWKKAIENLQLTGDTDHLARVYAWSARSAWWGYDPKRSLDICLEGLKAVEDAEESPAIAYLIHETGRAYLFNNQPDKARAYSEQALEIAKHLNAMDVQAETLATIGILPNIKPQQAIDALELAIKISESNGLYSPASRAYVNLAAVIDNLGEIRRARDYRMRAIRLGMRIGGISDEQLIQQTVTKASIWLADFQDAETRLEKIGLLIKESSSRLTHNARMQTYLEGSLYHFKGEFNKAIDKFTDLMDRSREIGDSLQLFEAHLALAETILEPHLLDEPNNNTGDMEYTLSMLNEIHKQIKHDDVDFQVNYFCLTNDIYTVMNHFDKAREALNKAELAYRDRPSMQDRFRVILSHARLEAGQGNYPKALSLLSQVERLLTKTEGRWWLARVWLEMANIHLKQNEPEDIDQAQNLLRESLAEFREMNVNYYPDIIIEKLRQVKDISRSQAIAHRKLSEELTQAGKVQHNFIPTHSPTIPGYDISGALLPARETSGDFFDFIDLGNDKLGVVIADVGDKGAGAALYMAISRTLIRTYAGENNLQPKDVLKQVNRRILMDTQHGIFLTLVFGILDPAQGTFTYVNAGHNPPILVRKKEDQVSLSHLEKTGTLIGIFEENTWEENQITIKTHEVLVLYTDGITEAQNEREELFGVDRLYQVLDSGFTTTAEKYRNRILESVHSFSEGTPRLDDITLIVISRE